MHFGCGGSGMRNIVKMRDMEDVKKERPRNVSGRSFVFLL